MKDVLSDGPASLPARDPVHPGGRGVGVLPQVLGFIFGPNRPDAAKNSPYECGFEAFEDARMKFDVRYYLVAILFILFDLEIAFLFPGPWRFTTSARQASGP
jgi:NADH:ubiquinone oxidoreductase subunit 3 (subunit A)